MGGLYKNNNKQIYVNRGLGHLGYTGRVGILPDISVLKIKMKSNSFNISYDIDNLLDNWDRSSITSNLKLNYLVLILKVTLNYYIYLFIIKLQDFISICLNLNLSKTSNYSKHWTKHLLKIIDLNVLLLSNGFDSTKNYFYLNKKLILIIY